MSPPGTETLVSLAQRVVTHSRARVRRAIREVVGIVFIVATLAVIYMAIYVWKNPVKHDQESENTLRRVAEEPERQVEQNPKSLPKRSEPVKSDPVKHRQSAH